MPLDEIILGPPKTAFASSRMASKGSIDATERSSKPFDPDEPKNDRFGNFRGKILNDKDAGDRDFDRRDSRPGAFGFRRGDNKEDWKDGRPRRTFGPDEQDRKPRRNGEFDRWEGKDNRDPRDPERGPKDKDGRFMLRRDGQPGRARFEGSWFRDDNAHNGPDAEEEKPSYRTREWRRDRHGADRDWTRGSKFEQEPEWLDATEPEEPRRVHTQEDFERWKERMKAGSAQAHGGDRKEPPVENVTVTTQKVEQRPTDGEIFSPAVQSDVTMERFFGLLGDKKPAPAPAMGSPSPMESPTREKAAAAAKPMKSSRFAGLFSPPPENHPKDPEPLAGLGVKSTPSPNTASSDADQEGFQRILQMLGGSKSRNGTPHNEHAQPPHPSMLQAEQARAPMPGPSKAPRPESMGMHEPFPGRNAGPGAQENPLSEDFDKDDPQAGRAQLLRLMQQVQINPMRNAGPNHGQPPSAGPAPGMMNMPPDVLPRPPGIQSPQKGAEFLDDPAIANMQRPEGRRPPMGFFDEGPFPPNAQIPLTPGGSRIPQGQNPPMGIPRPPGFEHMPPPPGWPGHQLPPQQAGAPGPLPPPPGIPARGINPQFLPNMMPMHGNMPPLNERQQFPRGPGGNGAAAFGPPPGMMPPPPGYMNMNGPPSGLPPEAFMGLGHGGQGPMGGHPGPQAPPPSSRQLLEMFGQGNGEGRGMPGPGQYR